MPKLIFILIVLCIIQACKSTKPLESYLLEKQKKVLLKAEGPAEFLYWEMDQKSHLWTTQTGKVIALNQYKDSLKLALGTQQYNAAVKKESIQNLEKTLLAKEKDGDRINALLVHTGNVGKIRQINYLESQILNYQVEKHPMFSQPTEFHAFITENKPLGKLRVYFAASDTEWPPHPTIILKELEKLMQKDWKLIRHLHNHYCKKDKNYVGILAPSLADAQYFKMLKERFKLDAALITNGFHTVEIKSEDFEKFESH